MFLIGVLGAILFAVSNASLAYLVKRFMNGTFVLQDPDVLWQVPVGVVVLFTLRGIGDYVANYFPSWVGRQVIKGLRHDLFRALHAPADRLSRTNNSPDICCPN